MPGFDWHEGLPVLPGAVQEAKLKWHDKVENAICRQNGFAFQVKMD
jgi:hypothetical protein